MASKRAAYGSTINRKGLPHRGRYRPMITIPGGLQGRSASQGGNAAGGAALRLGVPLILHPSSCIVYHAPVLRRQSRGLFPGRLRPASCRSGEIPSATGQSSADREFWRSHA